MVNRREKSTVKPPVVLGPQQLIGLLCKQIQARIPDGHGPNFSSVAASAEPALERSRRLFSAITLSSYRPRTNDDLVNHLHAGQWATFVYLVAHEAHLRGDSDLADRAYLLNRTLHGIDLVGAVSLPRVFFWEHPVGTVLGRAAYGDYFSVYQRCTVGGNGRLEYPSIGDRVTLYAGATVIGRTAIGDDVKVSANTTIIDEIIPAGSLVKGTSPHLDVTPRRDLRQPRWFTQPIEL